MTRTAALVRDIPDEAAPTTRCRILATAEEAFRLVGYQKTTVADIAKTLRMSPANVYRFFESKKAIHEAVIKRLMDDTEQRVAQAAAAPDRTAAARERASARVSGRPDIFGRATILGRVTRRGSIRAACVDRGVVGAVLLPPTGPER